MAKGRKKTRGPSIPMFHEPSPQERVESAAKYLVREALDTDPAVTSLSRQIARTVRRSTARVAGEVKKRARSQGQPWA